MHNADNFLDPAFQADVHFAFFRPSYQHRLERNFPNLDWDIVKDIHREIMLYEEFEGYYGMVTQNFKFLYDEVNAIKRERDTPEEEHVAQFLATILNTQNNAKATMERTRNHVYSKLRYDITGLNTPICKVEKVYRELNKRCFKN